jgi:hypothetical protein
MVITLARQANGVDAAVVADHGGEAPVNDGLERNQEQDGGSAALHLHGRLLAFACVEL